MMREKYTRLDFVKDIRSQIGSGAKVEFMGYWFAGIDNMHVINDDHELADAVYTLSTMEEGEEFARSYEELDALAEKFFEVDSFYPKLVEYRKDFDDWDNIDNFAEDARVVFRKEGVKAFPLLFSYLSYFNDKDYSNLVTADLKATKSLDPDFCIKEFITNIELLIPHADSWARTIIRAILKAPEYDACLDKYWHLADKDIFFDLLAMMDEGYYGEKYAPRIQELRDKLR